MKIYNHNGIYNWVSCWVDYLEIIIFDGGYKGKPGYQALSFGDGKNLFHSAQSFKALGGVCTWLGLKNQGLKNAVWRVFTSKIKKSGFSVTASTFELWDQLISPVLRQRKRSTTGEWRSAHRQRWGELATVETEQWNAIEPQYGGS